MIQKKYIFIAACLLALTSCHKGRDYFPKDIETEQIELVRFDKALMNVQCDEVQGTKDDIHVLYIHPPFLRQIYT